ncbi:MAG: hypothetical protein KF832_28950 [Caldilineaceae bacterium]|nr:hypothetical protein [Caldilineaceae bacterium]
MTFLSPILDQPQSIEWEQIAPDSVYRLANQELYFDVDANTDLTNLIWPWAGEQYVKHIALRVSAPREETLMPMVTRFFPGHQELILGTEGVIVTKRIAAPRQSDQDRSVIWLLDCQAEGDRLLRLEVTIDWGEPLTQRIVDGLLVAQRNPGPARGIYQQSNADLTCVFGNPQARPDQIDIEDAQRAHLVYHVLVNGMVEVPLLLTISDVGEQMAWNGFLALRDADRAFEISEKAWSSALKAGRLWTPNAPLNHAIQAGKLAALRHIQRLRTGFAASDHRPVRTPGLVDCLDTFDLITSRNLLAHLRRVAEATGGRLPDFLPLHAKDAVIEPEHTVIANNHAYLRALVRHLQHHVDAELLSAHYTAVGLCAEQVIRQAANSPVPLTSALAALQSAALAYASQLAKQQTDTANASRWGAAAAVPPTAAATIIDLVPTVLQNWQPWCERPRSFADSWQGIDLAGAMVWEGCGLRWQAGSLCVEPTWPTSWAWWALVDLPLAQGKLTLVWDGATLHSTLPIQSPCPVQLHQSIRARNTEDTDFDLHFELQSDENGEKKRQLFKPQFQFE